MSVGRRIARLLVLTVAYTAVSLLDRALFAAELERVNAATAALDLDDDDLEPADVSDVVERHSACCAPLAGQQ